MAEQGADGERVLGVGEVVRHAHAQRDRRHVDPLELGVEHADQTGDALVRRRGEAEPAGERRRRRAADDRRHAGVRDRIGGRAER